MKKTLLVLVSLVLVIFGLLYLVEYFAEIHPDEHAQHLQQEEHAHDQLPLAIDIPSQTATQATAFSTSIEHLPEAQLTATVELQDGDSYDITASYVKKQVGNRWLRMLAYNGSVPGPFLKAPQGAEITLNFTNNTDLEQTIHSHGIRVDNLSDGVPGITQDSVLPGQRYTYTVRFNDAGVYWYHPHTREDYGQELGLYGNYLVSPSEPDYWNQVNREVPLIIDDILIENNRIAEFYREFTNYALLGRFGNEYMVNGATDYSLKVTQGEVIRFFVTNVSNARTYNLSLPGVRMKLVGADIGKYEREVFADSFIISPAERVVFETYFDTPGTYTFTHTFPDNTIQLAKIIVTAEESIDRNYSHLFLTVRENHDVTSEFSGFRDYLQAEPDKSLLMTITLDGKPIDHSDHAHDPVIIDHSDHDMGIHTDHTNEQVTMTAPLTGMQWDDANQSDRDNRTPVINWMMVDENSGKVNMDINDWVFTLGTLIKIRLSNDESADHVMQHPIHFHGQRFVVLSENSIPNANMAWKDTVMVLPGQSIEILVSMDNTGVWMAHCHIAEHLHANMMLAFRVEDTDGHAVGDDYRVDRVNHPH
jgi:suppressor of ftsI